MGIPIESLPAHMQEQVRAKIAEKRGQSARQTAGQNHRPRHIAGHMNKLESIRAGELELMQRAGLIMAYKFESIKIRLARDTMYTPDFMVVMPDGQIRLEEIKGHWEDDARVKIKVAAGMYPFWEWHGLMRDRKTGTWKIEIFTPFLRGNNNG